MDNFVLSKWWGETFGARWVASKEVYEALAADPRGVKWMDLHLFRPGAHALGRWLSDNWTKEKRLYGGFLHWRMDAVPDRVSEDGDDIAMNTMINIDTDRLTIIVAGPMGSGKTTLLRKIEAALGAEYAFEVCAATPDRVIVTRR